MKLSQLMLIVLCVVICTGTCNASWFVYYKPEYKGRIVDIDTGQPIEGAVVIAFYKKETINPPVESFSSTIHAREALTDKDGYFRIPAYTTLISPLSWSGNVMFLIFKQGYLCPGASVLEDMFTGKDNTIVERSPRWNSKLIYRYAASGTVLLPKLTSFEDRSMSLTNFSLLEANNKLPMATKIQQDETNYLDSIRSR